eukprot:scaffold8776_cov78-Cylindrotheca_fusiformis.AAC.1
MYYLMQEEYRMRNRASNVSDANEVVELLLVAVLLTKIMSKMKTGKKTREKSMAVFKGIGTNKCFPGGEKCQRLRKCPKKVGRDNKRKSNDVQESMDGSTDCNLLFIDTDVSKLKVSGTKSELKLKDLWIADSGATVHSTNRECGMKNCEASEGFVTVGNGNTVKIQKYGQVAGQFVDKQGDKMMKATLDEVAYYPESAANVFSLTRMLKKGWTLGNNQHALWIKKGQRKILFDIQVETSRGVLYCANFQRDGEIAKAIRNNNKASADVEDDQERFDAEVEIESSVKTGERENSEESNVNNKQTYEWSVEGSKGEPIRNLEAGERENVEASADSVNDDNDEEHRECAVDKSGGYFEWNKDVEVDNGVREEQ